MTTQPEPGLEAVLGSLATFKQELAKVIAGMQAGGDRKVRRDLMRRLEACKRRARTLSRQVDEVLGGLDDGHGARPELETAAVFLGKVQDLGNRAG